MADDTKDTVEAEGPGGLKFKAIGSNIVPLLTLLLVSLMAYGGYEHKAEAANQTNQIVSAIKESVAAQREIVNAQREANCLNRLTPEQKKRQDEIDFCRGLGHGR